MRLSGASCMHFSSRISSFLFMAADWVQRHSPIVRLRLPAQSATPYVLRRMQYAQSKRPTGCPMQVIQYIPPVDVIKLESPRHLLPGDYVKAYSKTNEFGDKSFGASWGTIACADVQEGATILNSNAGCVFINFDNGLRQYVRMLALLISI